MPLALVFVLLTLVSVVTVFLAVHRLRGLRSALLAGALTFVGLSAVFVVMLQFLTSQM